MLLGRRTVIAAALAQLALAARPAWAAAGLGYFNGRVVTEWLADGRTMQLLEPFEYVGPDGRSWRVPAGAAVDGASIPQFFWSLIGGPFEGRYRAASVVHDFYCDVRSRKSADVHQVFHDAMLCAGVEPVRAWLMHQAVLRFGPAWADPDPSCEARGEDSSPTPCLGGYTPALQWPSQTPEELQQFVSEVSPYVDPWASSEMQEQVDRLLYDMAQDMLDDYAAGRCIEESPDHFVCP